jgi:DNA-binding transcriptional ArsR family regulator
MSRPQPHRSTEHDVFKAIADPTRRALLDQLRGGPLSVSALASCFSQSRPAISKHLKVLSTAGLLTERMVGREHIFDLHAASLREVAGWLEQYRVFWGTSLAKLKHHLEKT